MIMVSNVKNLTEICNQKISCNCINRIKFVIWSFTNNFNKIWDIISDDINNIGLNDKQLEQFIDICDNRLERSKAFLNEIAVVLGFDFVALSIIASMADIGEGDPLRSILLNSDYGILFRLLVIFLLGVIIPLFMLLAHCRSQIHAWTAFKEIALIKRCDGTPKQ